jgi:hypothetical protein
MTTTLTCKGNTPLTYISYRLTQRFCDAKESYASRQLWWFPGNIEHEPLKVYNFLLMLCTCKLSCFDLALGPSYPAGHHVFKYEDKPGGNLLNLLDVIVALSVTEQA